MFDTRYTTIGVSVCSEIQPKAPLFVMNAAELPPVDTSVVSCFSASHVDFGGDEDAANHVLARHVSRDTQCQVLGHEMTPTLHRCSQSTWYKRGIGTVFVRPRELGRSASYVSAGRVRNKCVYCANAMHRPLVVFNLDDVGSAPPARLGAGAN